MPAKKITNPTEKKPVNKTTAKKTVGKPEIKKKQPEKIVAKKEPAKPTQNIPDFDFDLAGNMNDSPIFDVFIFRELFMELRKNLDDLSLNRNRSDDAYAAYDEAVYNLTANAPNDCGAQDFLGYCYKKGMYDFCIMNFEKYMKWTILAASNGNAFSLSKLQLFLTTAVDNVLSLENHDYLIDFLGLTGENYIMFVSKMLCEEIVKILNISAESLIKMPEAYQEQTEELLKVFDKIKMEATEKVKKVLKDMIDQLENAVEKEKAREQLEKQKNLDLKAEAAVKLKTEEKELEKSIDQSKQETKAEPKKNGNAFRKNMEIKKKFRW